MSRGIKIFLALFGAALIWISTAPLLATSLITQRPISDPDAILVLSGSAVYTERIEKAIDLYRQGVAPKVIITNDGVRAGWLRSEKKNLPFVELERRMLIDNGVPPEDIIELPGVVSGTSDEANTMAEMAGPLGVRRLLVVTSAYHTRRALRTFDKIVAPNGVAVGIDHPKTGLQTPRPETWWLTFRGWQTVGAEYVKSIVYYLFY
jgi:uncharacterized SAM-binding protein YcdF (DUF218 family)